MKIIVALLLLLTISLEVSAQTTEIQKLPTKPMPEQSIYDWKFKALVLTLIGTTIADEYLTIKAIEKGCKESSPIMNPFVHSGKVATYSFGFSLDIVQIFAMNKLRHKNVQAWWVAPLPGIGSHSFAAIHNSRLGC